MTNPIKEEAGVFPDKTRLPAFRNVNSAASAVVGTGETTVTGTLVDEGGQVWKGAIVLINFFPTPNIPGPYMWQGGPFSLAPRLTADQNGFFSITIPDNTTITPAGSMWQFVIAPAATMPAVVFNLQISGTTQDISTVFTSQSYQVSLGTVQSLPLPRAYRDSEVATPPNPGQMYFNTSENLPRFYIGNGQWQNLMGSGGIYLSTTNINLNNILIGGFYQVAFEPIVNGPPPLVGTGAIGLLVWPSGDVNFVVQIVWNLENWLAPLRLFARGLRAGNTWTEWGELGLTLV